MTSYDYDLHWPTKADVQMMMDTLMADASPVVGDSQRIAAAAMLSALLPRLDAGIGPNDVGPCYCYERDFYPLSNFSAFAVHWNGIDFQTAEHAYQWAKFGTMPRDVVEPLSLAAIDARGNAADAIRSARSAHDAFKLAESLKAVWRPDWREAIVRVPIMESIMLAKARQHEYVRRKLWQSGDRPIVENSWRDAFWGWGPDRQGRNQLGLSWGHVRHILRSQYEFDAYDAARAAGGL